MICGRCGESGMNRHSGHACDFCDGEGWVSWMDILRPFAIIILTACVFILLVRGVWHLFAK